MAKYITITKESVMIIIILILIRQFNLSAIKDFFVFIIV